MDINRQLGTGSVVWDLRALYSSVDSPGIDRDMRRCQQMAGELSAGFSGRIAELDTPAMNEVVAGLESLDTLLGRLATFAFLSFITRTDDAPASKLLQLVEELEARVGRETVFFQLEWNRLDEDRARHHLQHPAIEHYAHYLQTMRQFAPYQLSRKEEELLQELRPVGRSAWNLLFEKLLGQLRFGPQGRTEEEVLSDLHHPDRSIRKNSADELTKGLRDNLHIITHIFNTLASEKAIDDRLRRYPSWDSAINLGNELNDSTVTTLVEAVTSRYDIVHRYYRLKRRLLSDQELFDYDRYAPVPGGEDRLISWEKARGTVLAAFADFSSEMAGIAERFFEEQWIHAPVLHGKRGGAFAHPCVPGSHPYIMVNYTGKIRDVSDLAHELGHGVHQVLAAEQGLYNSDTPLVLAETASVFAELLVFKRQVKLFRTPEARRAFVCQKLESIFATVFRQVAMNRFEAGMHNARRTEGELSAGQLSALWLKAQTPMFGDSLTLREDYGLWWSYIAHFLGTPGYVYAYAFGELLVLSLYARYLEEGDRFVDKYLGLLRAGGSVSPYAAVQPFGVDLDDPLFWHGGLFLIETMLVEADQGVNGA